MVNIVIKGTRKGDDYNGKDYIHTFEIAKFKAGVVLLESGGVQITISDRELSKKLDLFFKNETRA